MDNKKIAQVFEEMADILDIQGADFFRVNAYRKAAMTINNSAIDLRKVVDFNPKELTKIPGIGTALAGKITELILTGHCKEHEKLKKTIPEGLLEILNIRGIGPKKVRMFYYMLGIKNIKELKEAAKNHKIQSLEKMGKKSEEEILKAIDEYMIYSVKRVLISEALLEAERLIEYMKNCKLIQKIEYCGSLRRWQETIGDIDIMVTVKDAESSHEDVMKFFIAYPEVVMVVAEGDTKSSIILQSGINVDLRVVDSESFGAAMHYFTGSKDHNIRIRDIAKKKGLKVNEYGVFKGEKMVAGRSEDEVFKSVGLPFIIPEIRRDEGEIEYGLKHKKFPDFIELKDIKGDLHSHSKHSDGRNTIEEMAGIFIQKGYEYFAITDHSSVIGITGGMGKKEIEKQWKEIDGLNKKLKGKIKILKGVEVDILKNGELDFSDEVLSKLDVVIASAHMYSRLSEEDQTKRLIAAIENKYVKILGHPTGRLINKRPPMEFNMEKIIKACVMNNVVLEINSNPLRLDLSDKYVRMGKEMGAKFSIDTDSHSKDQPDFIKFGIGTARRGWLTKDDVINTRSLKNLTLSGKFV